ncbi:hypothetical protein AB6A40_002078 [Gnathostoma spinigerum]|uniref:Serpentine receptor class gamma n=1 Tax=Gnathostoma spinigerum TaxID=75299 RepID=A0ABD6EB58_9BILA
MVFTCIISCQIEAYRDWFLILLLFGAADLVISLCTVVKYRKTTHFHGDQSRIERRMLFIALVMFAVSAVLMLYFLTLIIFTFRNHQFLKRYIFGANAAFIDLFMLSNVWILLVICSDVRQNMKGLWCGRCGRVHPSK